MLAMKISLLILPWMRFDLQITKSKLTGLSLSLSFPHKHITTKQAK